MPHAADSAFFGPYYRAFIFISYCAKKVQKWKGRACKVVSINHFKKGIIMAFASIIISMVALAGAYLAFKKSGGSIEEMKRKVEDIGIDAESLRKKTADILEGFEKKLRGEEKKPVDKGDSQQAAA
jgi:hypothetical protein